MTNETCHPPKREGKPAKWATYLKAISLVNESTIVKKPDTKPTSFWNISPSPNANLAEISSFFCEPNAISALTLTDAQAPTMARAKHQRLANSRADRAAKYSLYSLAKMDNTAAPQLREPGALE